MPPRRNSTTDNADPVAPVASSGSRPRHSDAGGATKFSEKANYIDARKYDYIAARPPMKRTNNLECLGHMIKGSLGAGIVSVHEQYMLCGLWTALVLNVFIGFAVAYLIWILVSTARKLYGRVQVPMMTYPDMAEATAILCPYTPIRKYSSCFRHLVDVTVIVDLFGSCTVYIVVMARTVKQLYEMTDEADSEGIRYFILAMLIPLILIAWILELKYLAPFTIIGDIFIAIVALATVYYGTMAAQHSVLDTDHFPIVGKWQDVIMVMGALIYSVESVGVSLAIETHIEKPQSYVYVLALSYTLITFLVMVVGFFGLWGFGEKAKSPVTLNFPMSWVSIMLKVFMALMTYITFALQFWVPFDLCWHYIKRCYSPEKHWFWCRFYRSLVVCGLTCIALIFPDVAAFNSLIGSVCLSNMGFVYPAIMEFSVNWEDPEQGSHAKKILKVTVLVLFGFMVLTIGTISSVQHLIKNVYG